MTNMYSFFGNERVICELRMIGGVGWKSLYLDLRELVALKFHQCSYQLASEADFRNMPRVCKSALEDNNPNFKKHIIHGSFRHLNYLNVQKAGVLQNLDIIQKKKDEMERKTTVITRQTSRYAPLPEIVDISNELGQDLLEWCMLVRMILIRDNCASGSPRLHFDNLPQLERVEIGRNCFPTVTEVGVKNCSSIRRMFVGEGSFSSCCSCEIENNPDRIANRIELAQASVVITSYSNCHDNDIPPLQRQIQAFKTIHSHNISIGIVITMLNTFHDR